MNRLLLDCEAIIVTHDDPDAIAASLSAVLGGSVVPRLTRVVDTAGERAALPGGPGDERVVVQRLERNVGPAGGWAAGLRSFLDGDAAAALLLDDDCIIRSDGLATALAELDRADVVQSTMIDRTTGRVVSTQGWCGVLVPRYVVEKVGLPDSELVWWTEDTEYLQWRIPRAGFRVLRSPEVVVEVSLRPDGAEKPTWKYYYEARNQVAYRLRTQRPSAPEDRHRRHLTRRVRWWRATRSVVKLLARVVHVERRERPTKFAAVCRGTWHGLVGRTGLTVPLGESDRARSSTKASAR